MKQGCWEHFWGAVVGFHPRTEPLGRIERELGSLIPRGLSSTRLFHFYERQYYSKLRIKRPLSEEAIDVSINPISKEVPMFQVEIEVHKGMADVTKLAPGIEVLLVDIDAKEVFTIRRNNEQIDAKLLTTAEIIHLCEERRASQAARE